MTKPHSILFIWIFLIICGLGLVVVVYKIGGAVVAKYWGTRVMVTVIEVPQECGRRNNITVRTDGEDYSVRITRDECREKAYQPGDKLAMLRHKYYSNLLWTKGEYPELILTGMLLVFGYSICKATPRKRKPA